MEGAGAALLPATSLSPVSMTGIVRIVELILFLGIVRRFYGDLQSIGLGRKDIFSGIHRGAIWSVGFGLLAALSFSILYGFGINLLDSFRQPAAAKTSDIIILFIVGGILGPIAEEVFFRGILYGFLRNHLTKMIEKASIVAAMLICTVVFVLLHYPVISYIQIVGGLLFALSYEMEKMLMVPITIHILGNLSLFTLPYILNLF